MPALALHTFRECSRRVFPYVALLAVLGLTVASKLFLGFTFGARTIETANLALSAVFLVGFLHAAFQGTALVRSDLDRGTLGLVLAKPIGLGAYLTGRYLGLVLTTLALCLAMGGAVAVALVLLPGGGAAGAPGSELLLGCTRALLPLLVLDAAALAVSAVAPRTAAPVALIVLFLLGSLAGRGLLGVVFPDFALFGLEAGARPHLGLLAAYTAVFSSIFLLAAYIFLGSRAPVRSGS